MTNAAVDLSEGMTFVGASRTITDAEVALLPAFMGAISPLFHDEVRARNGPMGRRILYGPALLGIAVASTEQFLRDIVLGLLGIDRLRFRSAVGVGDTITSAMTVRERRMRPGKTGDVVTVEDRVHDQNGVVVLEFERTILVRRSDDASGG